jgi:hypothetical protein
MVEESDGDLLGRPAFDHAFWTSMAKRTASTTL